MTVQNFCNINATCDTQQNMFLVHSESNAFNVNPTAASNNICFGNYSLRPVSGFDISTMTNLRECIFLNSTVGSAANTTIINSVGIGGYAFVTKSAECILGGNQRVAINKYDPKYALHIGSNAFDGHLCIDSSTDPIESSIPANSGVFYVKNGVPLYANTTGNLSGYISTVIASGSATLTNGVVQVVNQNLTSTSFINITVGAYNDAIYRVVNQQLGYFYILSTNSSDNSTIHWKAST